MSTKFVFCMQVLANLKNDIDTGKTVGMNDKYLVLVSLPSIHNHDKIDRYVSNFVIRTRRSTPLHLVIIVVLSFSLVEYIMVLYTIL